MADRPKRPPTKDEPYRITRPRIAPPPPLPPRPAYRSKTELERDELVRAYVHGEEIPASDEPPPPSDPEPSFQSSVRDEPPAAPRARMVELPPDMTIRPRRSLHQKIKDWSETASHAQKIFVAVITIGTPAGALLYQWAIHPVITWVRTRTSIEEAEAAGKKACFDLLADAGKADEVALGALRAEVRDAGVLQGSNWDKQDEINANVHKELSRLRLQTPPKPIGPKATGKR